MPGENVRIVDEPLEPLLLSVRGQRGILDVDLARIYGVSTKALNQAVKRNVNRFPEDFAFQLDPEESANLRSQSVTSRRNQSSNQHGGRRSNPWLFTEHGALMAANVLRTERAAHMSIFVTRAFIRMREHIAANAAILKRLAEIDRTLLQHDAALRDVYRKLQPLLAPPADSRKRRIGF
jgi:ORF6N domain-containing protein